MSFLEEWLEGGLRDAVMAAGGLHGFELAGENPLLDGGIADAEEAGGFAWGEHLVGSGGHSYYF